MKKFNFLLFVLLIIPLFTVIGQGGGNSLNIVNELDTRDGDFVYCGSPNYNLTDKITVAVWIKWTSDPGIINSKHENEGRYPTIIAMDGHTTRETGQFWISHSLNGNKFEWTVTTAGGKNSAASNTITEIGKWYYLVGVYDNNADPKLKLYVNGDLEGIKNTGISGNIIPHSPNFTLNFGRMPSGYRYFSGNIDEARIWNTALTQAEIVQQMYSKATVASTDGYLLSYWSMDNISGSSVPDSKGVANGKFYTLLVDAHNTAPPTLPGGVGLSYGDNWLKDFDKTWTENQYAGRNFFTVAGNGFGNSYTIASNTVNTITLSSNFLTTPVVDNYGSFQSGPSGMSWFGIEGSTNEGQSVLSAAPIATADLEGFNDISGVWDSKSSNTSSILTIPTTNISPSSDDCVLLGHNNASLDFSSSGVPGSVNFKLNRHWKFQAHKSGGVTATFNIDCSGLSITDGSLLRLLVSNSSDFTSATVYTGTYSGGVFTKTDVSLTTGALNMLGNNSFITLGSTGALPVNLLSFNYYVFNNRNVNLIWKTNLEINNSGFDIERRSTKENQWHKIGFIAGKNNTSENTYTFADNILNTGSYSYRLKQIDYNGSFEYYALNGNVVINSPTKFKLSQNFPNPFNPVTKISYELPRDGSVSLILYDASGKEACKLVNGNQLTGYYTVTFDASNLPSGVYFYKLDVNMETAKLSKVMKCVLIK